MAFLSRGEDNAGGKSGGRNFGLNLFARPTCPENLALVRSPPFMQRTDSTSSLELRGGTAGHFSTHLSLAQSPASPHQDGIMEI
jgi:hypothetical protein